MVGVGQSLIPPSLTGSIEILLDYVIGHMTWDPSVSTLPKHPHMCWSHASESASLNKHPCMLYGYMPLSAGLGVVRAYQQVMETCLVRPDSSVVRASGICLDGPGFNSQSGCLFCLTDSSFFNDHA